jgi:general secretion pathway protein C
MATGNQLCQTQMFKPPAAASGAVAAAPAPMPAGGATPVGDDIKKGIQRIGPNEFNVDRGVVDKILENQAELMRQARIVPEQENGKVVGIRLFGVRADTLLGTLGMENGDRLEKINGFDMTSPEKALEAYARLRTADHLTISLNRKGQEQNLDYNIK